MLIVNWFLKYTRVPSKLSVVVFINEVKNGSTKLLPKTILACKISIANNPQNADVLSFPSPPTLFKKQKTETALYSLNYNGQL